MTEFHVRTANLKVINSMTKYPSIPTYHTLDHGNGGLLEEAVPFDGTVIGTEKVDGTNSRIVLLPDGTYLLGSREELLYAQGDLIGNPALGIVDVLHPIADALIPVDRDHIVVYFLEVYGGKVTAASKQDTGNGRSVGFRLFDIAVIDGYADLLAWDPQRVAGWRDGGGQQFHSEAALSQTAEATGLELTPRLFELDATALPTDIEKTKAFLDQHLPATLATLDDGAGGRAGGRAASCSARRPARRSRRPGSRTTNGPSSVAAADGGAVSP